MRCGILRNRNVKQKVQHSTLIKPRNIAENTTNGTTLHEISMKFRSHLTPALSGNTRLCNLALCLKELHWKPTSPAQGVAQPPSLFVLLGKAHSQRRGTAADGEEADGSALDSDPH